MTSLTSIPLDSRQSRSSPVRILLLLWCGIFAWTSLGFCADDPLAQRAVVNAGNTARLERVLAKARRGETVTIGVIGGSITQGAKASRAETRYANLVTDWWRQTFPRAKIVLVNAGVGATATNYGALRVQRDLLARNPDFIIVEFAANDRPEQPFAETMEGLVRQILAHPNRPAVLMLSMVKNTGVSAEEWHAKVGRHYDLPMISYRAALWPELEAGRMKWPEIGADDVHPNDRGMALAAGFVTHFLKNTADTLPPDDRLPPIPAIAVPLFTDLFEHTALFEDEALRPTHNVGWSYDPTAKSWTSKQPGSVMEFEASGRWFILMFLRLRADMGMVKVQVDDGPPKTLDAWFPGTWGSYRDIAPLSQKLPPGRHRIKIELLKKKNAESNGSEFRILGLGAAGVEKP